MKCDECKWCVLEDYGYSNYTVEGTGADCLLDLNPDLPADHRWGEASALAFANVCPRFKEGNPLLVDVETDGNLINYTNDTEVIEFLEKQLMWKVLKDDI